jgi:hypothetical protein
MFAALFWKFIKSFKGSHLRYMYNTGNSSPVLLQGQFCKGSKLKKLFHSVYRSCEGG